MDVDRDAVQTRLAPPGSTLTPRVRPLTSGPTTEMEGDSTSEMRSSFAEEAGKSNRSIGSGTEARAPAKDVRRQHDT